MMQLITLTSDFGQSEYVAAMKGAILSINPDAGIVDLSHVISPQNVLEGAYVLYSTAAYFRNAVHVGVVDPGVGTGRKGLLIECEMGYLVGPDNGLLLPCARRLGLKKIYHISNKDFFLSDISDTFHGRDIFAPVAAHLSKGVAPDKIGDVVDDYVDLDLKYQVLKDDNLEGKIIHHDSFGNLITSLSHEVIKEHFKFGSSIDVAVERKNDWNNKKMRFIRSYGFGEKAELLATISSSGFFELACNQGSARDYFNADLGSKVRIRI